MTQATIGLPPASTLAAEFAAAADRNPRGRCLTQDGSGLTYAETLDRVLRLAAAFQAHGVRPGDRVAVCMGNRLAYPVACQAAWRIGAMVAPLNALYPEPMLDRLVEDCRPAVLVGSDDPALSAALGRIALRHGVGLVVAARSDNADLLDPAAFAGDPVGEGAVPLVRLLAQDGEPSAALPRPEDPAILQYTGGTTGLPKAAVLTHAAVTINQRQILDRLPRLRDGEERFMAVGPFSHITTMNAVLLAGIRMAAEIVVVRRFEPEATTRLCLDSGISYFAGVPTMLIAMSGSEAGRTGDWSALKHLICGGAPLALEVKRRFEGVTGCTVQQGYGLSETAPGVTMMEHGTPWSEGSSGTPFPGTSVSLRALDGSEAPVPARERGEVCVSGPQLMLGYWNRPEETAAVLRDGVLRTGDIGFFDETGQLHVVDRLKDIIISSGYNVYPAQVEEALYQHPAVAEAAVVGVADPYRGEIVQAVVSLRPGQTLELEALQAFLKERLSPIEIPRALTVLPALPKSPAGKILRRAVRDTLAQEA